jgi:hypothetical protein
MWEPTEGIGVLTKADAVVLMFRSRSWGDEYGPTLTQRIPITWTFCTLGGRRPWFRCEVYTNRCLKRETRTIPVVFASGTDPIASGIVPGLDRPGGNVTGGGGRCRRFDVDRIGP